MIIIKNKMIFLTGGIEFTMAPNLLINPKIIATKAAKSITIGLYILVTDNIIKFSAYVVIG